MSRRPLVAVALLTAAAVSTAPAHAATKPRPLKGSYNVTLLPDPTPNVTNTVGKDGCTGLSPEGVNSHSFKVPAAGKLHVVLDSADPTGTPSAGPAGSVGTDWDLYVLDSDGVIVDGSHGGTSHEETTDKFKKAQQLSIQVCNLAGEPNATVSFTFTYA
jgi:hypothetical protein